MVQQLTIRQCGDTAFLVEVGDNSRVHALAEAVRAAHVEGITDLVPALTTLLVVVDPDRARVADVVQRVRTLPTLQQSAGRTRTVEIPVTYDGEDLAWVARHCGLTEHDVVRAHTGKPWRVAFCGFAPGFSYCVGGDPRLQVPRRGESRVAVPAGAVAIAAAFSAVYPRRSPGGWQILGHTDVPMWDSHAEPPALLVPGHWVQFRESAG